MKTASEKEPIRLVVAAAEALLPARIARSPLLKCIFPNWQGSALTGI